MGAAASDNLVVLSDGMDPHTGWLPARLAVRAIATALAPDATFAGAADVLADDWGWMGSMQNAAAGERVYNTCANDLASPLPRDLASLFAEVDRVLQLIQTHDHSINSIASTIAATIDGTRIRGVHAGVARALLWRAGADGFEELVVPHYLHLVHQRSRHPVVGVPSESLPQHVVLNVLGMLESAGVGIDPFETTLAPGDILFLTSRTLDMPDKMLLDVFRLVVAVSPTIRLDQLADSIQSHADRNTPETSQRVDAAFALLRCR